MARTIDPPVVKIALEATAPARDLTIIAALSVVLPMFGFTANAAQHEIATDWIKAYQKYIAKSPPASKVHEPQFAPETARRLLKTKCG